MSRPPVAIVIPFFGDREDAERTLGLLAGISRRPGDRAILADNTPGAVAAGLTVAEGVEVLVCEEKCTAYGARNEAIAAVDHEWLLLLDDDCRPEPDILDRYFEPPPGARTGLVSGAVGGLEGQRGFVPAYARARRHLDQQVLLTEHVFRPMAVTANLLVRREAWEAVGGFAELVRSGADGDFCWRVQDVGWELEHRPLARAPHVHRASVPAMLRKALRDGAANPWLARRWPGYPAGTNVPRHLARALIAVPGWIVRGQPSKSAYKAFDVVWTSAADLGRLTGNRIPRALPSRRPTLLLAEFPSGPVEPGLRVEALRRPLPVQDWRAGRVPDAFVVEDDGPLDRWRALLALAARRPIAVVRALRSDRLLATALAPAALRLGAAGGELREGDGVTREAALLRLLAG